MAHCVRCNHRMSCKNKCEVVTINRCWLWRAVSSAEHPVRLLNRFWKLQKSLRGGPLPPAASLSTCVGFTLQIGPFTRSSATVSLSFFFWLKWLWIPFAVKHTYPKHCSPLLAPGQDSCYKSLKAKICIRDQTSFSLSLSLHAVVIAHFCFYLMPMYFNQAAQDW